jgi:hypothetical protein
VNGPLGFLRDDLPDTSDRPPERTHDLAPLPEWHARGASRGVDRVEERPFELPRQPLCELLEGRLSQSHSKRTALASLENLVAGGPDHLGGDRLCKRSGDTERRELCTLVGCAQGADYDDGHRLGEGILEEGSNEDLCARQIDVDHHQIGRVGASQLKRRVDVVGELAFEGAARRVVVDEGLGERNLTDDENRGGRVCGRLGRARGGAGVLSVRVPRERGQVVERPGGEFDVGALHLPELDGLVEHGESVLKSSRHGVEVQEPGARAERVQPPPKLVAKRLGRRIVAQRCQKVSRSSDLLPEGGHEVGSRAAELFPVALA